MNRKINEKVKRKANGKQKKADEEENKAHTNGKENEANRSENKMMKRDEAMSSGKEIGIQSSVI